jgi:hypothetical protein
MHAANGIDFIEQLVRKGCRQRRFALMSGCFSEVDLSRAAQLGCKLFSKPVDIGLFLEWVEEVERSMAVERILYDWVDSKNS